MVVSPAGTEDPRVCVMCHATLEGRRRDALYCSGACRAEGGRHRAILRGEGPQGYRSIAERINCPRSRTNWLRRGTRDERSDGEAT